MRATVGARARQPQGELACLAREEEGGVLSVPRKRTPIPKPEELSADSGRFIQDLQQETDRGVALVGAAFLDDAVRALIRAALIKESETADRLFEYPRPLATFDAHLRCAN